MAETLTRLTGDLGTTVVGKVVAIQNVESKRFASAQDRPTLNGKPVVVIGPAATQLSTKETVGPFQDFSWWYLINTTPQWLLTPDQFSKEPYYTIQNVATGKYAWVSTDPKPHEPVYQDQQRLWKIDKAADNVMHYT